jgi:hypothetical protein
MRKQRQIDLVPPPAPTADTRIIRRQAKLLDQQRKTLGDISLEAIKIATIQLAVKKIEEGLRLLQQAGIERSPQTAPAAPLAPVVKNPCAQCGREGVYQSKRARVSGPGASNAPAPWYCQTHAQWAMQEDHIEQQSQKVGMTTPVASAPPPQPVAAAPAPTPPKLADAMASLQGQRP